MSRTAGQLLGALDNLSLEIAASASRGAKHKLAVLPFVTPTGEVVELGTYLADALTNRLFAYGGQFQVVDRVHLDAVLLELEWQQREADVGTIASLGKMTGADTVVTGSLTDLGEEIDVTIRMLETERATVMAVASALVKEDANIRRMFSAAVPRYSRGAKRPIQEEGEQPPGDSVQTIEPSQNPVPARAEYVPAVFESVLYGIRFVSGGTRSGKTTFILRYETHDPAGCNHRVCRVWGDHPRAGDESGAEFPFERADGIAEDSWRQCNIGLSVPNGRGADSRLTFEGSPGPNVGASIELPLRVGRFKLEEGKLVHCPDDSNWNVRETVSISGIGLGQRSSPGKTTAKSTPRKTSGPEAH